LDPSRPPLSPAVLLILTCESPSFLMSYLCKVYSHPSSPSPGVKTILCFFSFLRGFPDGLFMLCYGNPTVGSPLYPLVASVFPFACTKVFFASIFPCLRLLERLITWLPLSSLAHPVLSNNPPSPSTSLPAQLFTSPSSLLDGPFPSAATTNGLTRACRRWKLGLAFLFVVIPPSFIRYSFFRVLAPLFLLLCSFEI